jgi:hypothetical protein
VSKPEVCDWEIRPEEPAVSEPGANEAYGLVNCWSVADMVLIDEKYRGPHMQIPAVETLLPSGAHWAVTFVVLYLQQHFRWSVHIAEARSRITPTEETGDRRLFRPARVKDGNVFHGSSDAMETIGDRLLDFFGKIYF